MQARRAKISLIFRAFASTNSSARLAICLTERWERARTQLKAGLLMGLESPSARAERMARLVAIWDRVPSLSETVEKIDAVTLADLRSFGAGLHSSEMAMAVYGPADRAYGLEALKERRAA